VGRYAHGERRLRGVAEFAYEVEVEIAAQNCNGALCMTVRPFTGTNCPVWLDTTRLTENHACFGYSRGEDYYCPSLLPDGDLLLEWMESAGMDAGRSVVLSREEAAR
jgi:hypothetical protein